MTTRHYFLLAISIVALGSTAIADVDRAQILGKLHCINQTQIKAGQLAEENGESTEVKDYGRKLVSDHKKIDSELSRFATKYNVTVADIQPSDQEKADLSDLQNATGVDFDKKFLATMVKGQEDAINMVKTARDESKDSKFKSFLAKIRPSLERHFKTAEKIEKQETM